MLLNFESLLLVTELWFKFIYYTQDPERAWNDTLLLFCYCSWFVNIRLFHDSPPAQEVAKKINDLRKKTVRTKNQPNKKPPKPRTKQTNKKSCFGLCSTRSTQLNYQSKAVEDNSTCNKDGKWIWITTAPIIPISYQQVQNVQHWSQRTCNIVALKKKNY